MSKVCPSLDGVKYGVLATLTILPDVQRLETVDHGTVISVGGGSKNNERQADVSLAKSRVFVPGHRWELTPSKAECALRWGLHCV